MRFSDIFNLRFTNHSLNIEFVGRISDHFFESGSGSGENGTRYRISQPDSARSFLAVSSSSEWAQQTVIE